MDEMKTSCIGALLHGCLQRFWIGLNVWFLVFSPVFAFVLSIYLLFTKYWFLVALYCLWLYYDRKAPKGRSRPWRYFQNMKIWQIAVEYFPMRLVKTTELDPSKNYLMGYHPHGIFAFGAILSCATGGCGVYEKFPEFKFRGTTLPINFYSPFRREYLLAIGAIDTSAESIEYALSDPSGGTVVGLAIGGAREALEARPGMYKFVLRCRRGFVRLAMKTGADLLPCISFGENDMYYQLDNPPGSLARRFQEIFKKIFTFTLPLFYGDGLKPLRRPVTVVIGKPMPVERVIHPTEDEIQEVHQKYIGSLSALFEEYKPLYADPSAKLEIM